MKNQSDTISLVIPVYNGERTIGVLLDSLKHQSAQPTEVIVVDNASDDHTKQVLEEWKDRHPTYPLTVVDEKKRGRNHARNRGVAAAKGAYIAFVDADCMLDRQWVSHAYGILRRHSYAVVGGVVDAYGFQNRVERVLHVLHCPKELKEMEYKRVDDIDIMRGSLETNNVIVLAEALRSVDGFEENGYNIVGEDFDLFLRLYRKGWELIGHHKKLVVYHQHRSCWKDMIIQVYGYGYSFAECVSKHFGGQFVMIGNRRSFTTPFPFGVWLRASNAFLCLAGMVVLLATAGFPYCAALGGLAFVALAFNWYRRLRRDAATVSMQELCIAVLTAVVHKGALFAGHVRGSVRFKVVCL